MLAILGLLGVFPNLLVPIAGLCVAGALLFEGGAIAARYERILHAIGASTTVADVGGGLSAEFAGGAAGVVLSILALAGIYPMLLMPAAMIVFGAAVLFGSAVSNRLNDVLAMRDNQLQQVVAREAASSASGLKVLVGLGAVVLGILGVVGFVPEVLTLVALLSLGTALLFTGTAMAGKVLAIFRH